MLRRIRAIFDYTIRDAYHLASVLIALGWLSICFEVVMRYFFNRPQAWVRESTEYSLVFITFLAAAWLLKGEGHVKMDWLVNRLSPRGQALLTFITSIIGAITFLVVTWYTAKLTLFMHVEGIHVLSELEPPQAPLAVVIPIGSFLLSIQFVRRAYNNLAGWKASRDYLIPSTPERGGELEV